MQRLLAASASLREPRNLPVILLVVLTAAVLIVVPLRLPTLLNAPLAGASYRAPTIYVPPPKSSPAQQTAIADSDILAQASGDQAQRFQDLTPQAAAAFNASRPISPAPLMIAKAFRLPTAADPATSEDAGRALQCLSLAVYYEAGFESAQGEAAVAQVVLNRVRHPIFPKTVCGVVFQGSQLPTGCQFTFTCDGSLGRPPDPKAWARAQAVAQRALAGYVEKSVGTATHYHTQWVVPYWEASLVKLTQIGAHIFYRWGGSAGLLNAFNGAYAGAEPALPALALSTAPALDPLLDLSVSSDLARPMALAQSEQVQTLQTVQAEPLKIARIDPVVAVSSADMSRLESINPADAAHPVVPAILAQNTGFGAPAGHLGR